MNYLDNLKQLRAKLAAHKMSLLVGAGFSKNVDKTFPDWKGLLFDLVIELYRDEITSQLPLNVPLMEKEDRIWEIVNKLIDKKSYLGIVSEYINKKGYEEAIVDYIEKRIPIIEDQQKYYLLTDDQRTEITPEQLRLHKQLLTFPWNNVFTTNYDPLLEASVNIHQHNKLSEDNKMLDEKINELIKSTDELKSEIEIIRLAAEKAGEQQLFTNTTTLPAEESSQPVETEEQREQRSKQIDKLSDNVRKNELQIEVLRKERGIKETIAGQSYTTVVEGAQLSIKRTKNIIKLHGSLRSQQERDQIKFEFDGDPNKHYVISAEHYQSYPEKHEAFTQLMRISLLQESYCLIGFSGDDPNFRAWINWVKDKLFRARHKENGLREYKIYLMDMSHETTKEDRLLFYENHQIIRIPLLSMEVTQFLEEQTGKTFDVNDKGKSILRLLFDFLAEGNNVATPIIENNIFLEEQWKNEWRGLIKIRNNRLEPDTSKLDETIDILSNLSADILIQNLSGWGIHDQLNFVLNAAELLPSISNKIIKEKLCRLLTLGLPNLFLPISNVFSDASLIEMKAISGANLKFQELLKRNQVMVDPTTFASQKVVSDMNGLLAKAFTFSYHELINAVRDWDASDTQLHQKAGFMAQFNPSQAIKLIEQQIASENISEQQRMISYELLNFLCRADGSYSKSEEYKSKEQQYKSAGYNSLIKILQDLISIIRPALAQQVKPYGDKKFSISRDELPNSKQATIASLQYLSIIIEFGIPLKAGNTLFVSLEDWYAVFKVGFEQYPIPYLYYSIQLKDEKTVQRIAQDITYSPKLAKIRQTLVQLLLDSFLTINSQHIRDMIMVVLGELFHSVDPQIWQYKFHASWKVLRSEDRTFRQHERVIERYIKSALRLVKEENVLHEFLLDILSKLNNHKEKVIDFLYYLHFNNIFKNRKSRILPEAVNAAINHIINDITHHPENSIFALGNLHYLLTNDQLEKIHGLLRSTDLGTIANSRAFRPMLHFTKGDKHIHKKLKKAIFSHEDLWATGIAGNSFSIWREGIPIAQLSDKANPASGLHFTKTELMTLFKRLKNAFIPIPEMNLKRLDVDFLNAVEPMRDFLLIYESELTHHPSYKTIIDNVNKYFYQYSGFTTIYEGLQSHRQEVVLKALSELSREIAGNSYNPQAISLLLNKLLLRSGPALEAILNYVAVWLEDDEPRSYLCQYMDLLTDILGRFRHDPLPDAETPFINEMIVRIAYHLDKMGAKHENISYWLTKGRDTFYNCRLWLEAKSLE